MTWTIGVAIVGVIGTIWGLLKRYESRLVLLVGGFFMAILSLNPMMAFQQFDKSMTNGGLIIAICSAMGFAGVVALTKCDLHLVALLTKPLKKLGFFLMPACMLVSGVIAIAIPRPRACAPRSARRSCRFSCARASVRRPRPRP